MSHRPRRLLHALVSAAAVPLLCAAAAGRAAEPIEEILVSATASLVGRLGEVGSMSVLSADEIAAIGATHVTETLSRVPGVWIARGSGQEHLTAIRSPVYAGLGACGEFLFLEDGIPIRPAGFCNINNLFEVNSEQAAAIEVWRGPASAVLGGNALRGAINFLTPAPTADRLMVEGGPYDFYRIGLETAGSVGAHTVAIAASGMATNGWRDHTAHEQQKLSLVHGVEVGGWDVRNTLSVTQLDQETGAFVSGYEAYEDDSLRRDNPSPDSYRDAWSLRVASHWSSEGWTVTPYLRRSRMDFLQHFIAGQPWEKNSQTSGGVMLNHASQLGDLEFELGLQAELMSGALEEYQEQPLTTSSPFNNAVRPQGTHYDFDVDSQLVAGHYDLVWTFAPDLRLIHTLRLEWQQYDYDNLALDGNTRDDGTPCGFGGCLYNRPADRDDTFENAAGRLGLEKAVGADGILYSVIATGYRPPQVNELYRLQRGQDVADLDSERIVALELGFKAPTWTVAAFTDRATNFIFRDSAGLNVSDGKTRSLGVELTAQRAFGSHTLEVSTTYAEHRYDFTGGATGGEFIEDGNMMDTAPRWLGNAAWRWTPTARFESEIEFTLQGEHYINADNTAEYGGHGVYNWRGRYVVNDRTTLSARIMNLLNDKYADRADYSLFDPARYRYFPAMPRQLYLGVTFAL
jgi:iron complex outermembrane receptor protein